MIGEATEPAFIVSVQEKYGAWWVVEHVAGQLYHVERGPIPTREIAEHLRDESRTRLQEELARAVENVSTPGTLELTGNVAEFLKCMGTMPASRLTPNERGEYTLHEEPTDTGTRRVMARQTVGGLYVYEDSGKPFHDETPIGVIPWGAENDEPA